jgi:hypothetical protein
MPAGRHFPARWFVSKTLREKVPPFSPNWRTTHYNLDISVYSLSVLVFLELLLGYWRAGAAPGWPTKCRIRATLAKITACSGANDSLCAWEEWQTAKVRRRAVE